MNSSPGSPAGGPAVEAVGDRLSVTLHDTLYDDTVTLEADLLRHMHLENDILHQRARALENEF